MGETGSSPPTEGTAPAAWLRELLGARVAEHAEPGAEPDPSAPVSLRALLEGVLQSSFDRMVAEGTPAAAVATYLAGWYPGSLASTVGAGLAAGRAGFCLEPAAVVWHVHPDGWIVSLDVAPREVLVEPDHAWAGRSDVTVVASTDELTERTVGALVELARPMVEACHGLTKVGAAGLWNEVGDALGTALTYQATIEATEERVALLERAVATQAPWRTHPTLWFADSSELGRVHVTRKGGCCLAYLEPYEGEDVDAPAMDPDHRAYLERFPQPPGEPYYCSTCSLRDLDGVAERQVFWHERHRRQPTNS